jgi:hypothetical protein
MLFTAQCQTIVLGYFVGRISYERDPLDRDTSQERPQIQLESHIQPRKSALRIFIADKIGKK